MLLIIVHGEFQPRLIEMEDLVKKESCPEKCHYFELLVFQTDVIVIEDFKFFVCKSLENILSIMGYN